MLSITSADYISSFMKQLYFLLLVIGLCAPAFAQQKIVFGGPKIEIGKEQKTMLDAANKVMEGDLPAAEALYTSVIAMNASNIDAYLQRGFIRRIARNAQGSVSDARAAAALANAQLQANPNNADAYHSRGMAYRLANQYAQARKDIETGMRLNNNQSWQSDLQAIALEEKAAR
jgi:tetratricopeptide (TPR) repeat protein